MKRQDILLRNLSWQNSLLGIMRMPYNIGSHPLEIHSLGYGLYFPCHKDTHYSPNNNKFKIFIFSAHATSPSTSPPPCLKGESVFPQET